MHDEEVVPLSYVSWGARALLDSPMRRVCFVSDLLLRSGFGLGDLLLCFFPSVVGKLSAKNIHR